ncbi:MAG: hypothetical protein FJ038_13630 [Chloroflexi bacterium]|nr:hypothetical protein [Chloroflexota bacterium]
MIGAWQDAVQPLLRQQCWCWGWDVRRREGNLLLKRRFQRSRPPEATVGSSAYRLNGTGYRIGLWGFGVFYSRPALGAVFMGRHVEGPLRSPLVVPPRHVWTLDDLPRMSPVGPDADAADLYLLVELFRWIARYERWVQRTVGAEYREAAINRWGEEPVVSAAEMAPTWNAVGRGVVRA